MLSYWGYLGSCTRYFDELDLKSCVFAVVSVSEALSSGYERYSVVEARSRREMTSLAQLCTSNVYLEPHQG